MGLILSAVVAYEIALRKDCLSNNGAEFAGSGGHAVEGAAVPGREDLSRELYRC